MRTRYLTLLLLTLTLLTGVTVAYVASTDPMGIFRNTSADLLSRINQFQFMRTSKPLRLFFANPDLTLLGTSRAARLSPDSIDLEHAFNAALPGATPRETLALLSYAQQHIKPEQIIIGLDFDAYLSRHPEYRNGFNQSLLESEGRLSHGLNLLLTLKRAFFSPEAIDLAYIARHPAHERHNEGAVYLADGSWYRHPTGVDFSMLSRQKLREAESGGDHPELRLDALASMLDTCQRRDLNCTFLVTPIHLFHTEILAHTGSLALWREWHRQLVVLNEQTAQAHSSEPLPIWGFNTFYPAVGETLTSRTTLRDPWFKDNIHFRIRFGDLMLREVLRLPGNPTTDHGVRLTTQNIEHYLDQVMSLRDTFLAEEQEGVDVLRQKLGL